jgi:hypothetical protein
VKKDPHSTGTAADIAEQTKLALTLRDDIDAVVDTINAVEWVRKQLADLAALLEDRKRDELRKAAQALEAKVVELAGRLYDTNLTGAREDAFRSPMRLYGRLCALASNVSASGADFRPTDQQAEVRRLLREQAAATRTQWDALLAGELPGFNALLREKGMAGVSAP